MILLDGYLLYLHEKRGSSISKNIRSGKLSDESIERLKKAGLIKSEREYKKGIERGIKNQLRGQRIKWRTTDIRVDRLSHKEIDQILRLSDEEFSHMFPSSKRDDFKFMKKITTPKGSMSYGPATHPDAKTIYIPNKMNKGMMDTAFGSKEDYRRLKPIVKKHEADEFMLTRKLKKKYNIKGSLAPSPLPNLNAKSSSGKLYGQHYGPEVLKKEKKIVDFYHRVHNKLDHWMKVRQPEYDELKKYGHQRAIRKARERGLRKGIRDAIDMIENHTVTDQYSPTKQQMKTNFRPYIKKQLAMLPKNKINIKFTLKVLKYLK